MLGKLFKYDFKALSRVMLPLQGGVLLVGTLGCLLVNVSFRNIVNSYSYSYSSYSSQAFPLEAVVGSISMMLAILFFSILFASSYVTLFLIARHMYKNLLKDEGYLSFTLPVTAGQQLLSKTMAGALWLMINAALLVLSILLLTIVGFAEQGFVNTDVLAFYREALKFFSNAEGFFLIFELIVMGVVASVFAVLQVYFSLIVGAAIARSYKALAGIGIYVATGMVLQGVISTVVYGLIFALTDTIEGLIVEGAWFTVTQIAIVPSLLLYMGLAVTFFLVSVHLLKTKLNLD